MVHEIAEVPGQVTLQVAKKKKIPVLYFFGNWLALDYTGMSFSQGLILDGFAND